MKYHVKLTLTEELLGTASANPDLYEEFIASKLPENADEELESLPEVSEELQKATTVFHRDALEGNPIIYDYQIKGFFKDACSALRRADKTLSKKMKAYKKIIDGIIFVHPRQILAKLPEGGEIGICQRPLRAQTAQGERVSLSRSETLPIGTSLEFEVTLLSKDLEDVLHEWLDYGALKGLGQWRNSGKGRFEYTSEKVS